MDLETLMENKHELAMPIYEAFMELNGDIVMASEKLAYHFERLTLKQAKQVVKEIATMRNEANKLRLERNVLEDKYVEDLTKMVVELKEQQTLEYDQLLKEL